MFQTNRLTILVPDNAVYTDLCCILGLDLSGTGLPEDVRALQWKDGSGHIEYVDSRHNLEITELPDWAINCLDVWEQELIKHPPIPPEMAANAE